MARFGGECEVSGLNYYRTVTASGRDSLRLIVESGQLQKRVFLIPDFLCQVIVDTLNHYKIQYRTYSVQKDFSCLLGAIQPDEVIYLIQYFGHSQAELLHDLKQHTVIIDDVFSPFPPVLTDHASWYSFNSLRKISPLADGSLLYSSHPLDEQRMCLEPSTEFSKQKYLAKYNKFAFVHYDLGQEADYLALFSSAEALHDARRSIQGMSIESQIAFAEFCAQLPDERRRRQENYQTVCALLPDQVMPCQTDFHSFAPLWLHHRDAIKYQLMKQQIYLPIHWPGTSTISQHVLSIPLDGRYNQRDMQRVCEVITAAHLSHNFS